MKKIEIIWREILTRALEEKKTVFSQKNLAQEFGFSTSTTFQALKKPRATGAVSVHGRFFELTDFEKLLFLWATERNLSAEIICQTRSNLGILEMEGSLPVATKPTAYTAFRLLFSETPADYDKVYAYSQDIEEIRKRFPPNETHPNLFVLKPDSILVKNAQAFPPLPQIFVDLWNLSDWYAKEYQGALLDKMKHKLGL